MDTPVILLCGQKSLSVIQLNTTMTTCLSCIFAVGCLNNRMIHFIQPTHPPTELPSNNPSILPSIHSSVCCDRPKDPRISLFLFFLKFVLQRVVKNKKHLNERSTAERLLQLIQFSSLTKTLWGKESTVLNFYCNSLRGRERERERVTSERGNRQESYVFTRRPSFLITLHIHLLFPPLTPITFMYIHSVHYSHFHPFARAVT